jgi:asparagine synthase (glutamine-hydrolysing)
MCGIAGFFDLTASMQRPEETLRSMTARLVHRGPDADGHWQDTGCGVGLGHRRLAIVDLSAEGAQPMVSASGRYVVVFNGEIYNFPEVRHDLEKLGTRFRGHSDTEVMLAAIDQWGFAKALPMFNGMFALALWDKHERKLWLARDRLGKKPLYYGVVNGALVFASELKAIRVVPGFRAQISRQALTSFLRHNYVPTPYCIYEGLSKLEAGYAVSFVSRNGQVVADTRLQYWSAAQAACEGAANRYTGSLEQAEADLDILLRDAVRMRMVSDVPLGAFLSGGIDSSLVVALMQAQSATPVRTFTVGFDEADFNEAVYAKRIARHLGTDHTEILLAPADALNVIPRLADIYDEPFSDSSQIPTYLVCREARRHVTVCLSGDGGDEGFCGYNRYVWWRQIWKVLRWLPHGVRQAISSGLGAIPVETLDRIMRPALGILPSRFRYDTPGEKLHKLAAVIGEPSPDALYRRLISHWNDPAGVVLGGIEPDDGRFADSDVSDRDAFTERMMLLDILNYLPDDILVKVDRASMAVSLEVRAPLLDYRVLEFGMGLPLDYKLRGTSGKHILRQILGRYVPLQMFDRAKTGFGVPIEQWLRGPLRDWAEDLLTPGRLRDQGFFSVDRVQSVWNQHINRQKPGHYLLWDILMFQAWLDNAGTS